MKTIKRIGTSLMGAVATVLGSGTAVLAADHAEAAASASYGTIGLAAGIAIGAAAIGAGLGQGRATASAMESIGRNPNSADRIQTPMIIGLAMMEALAIYALVIAFFLQGKIPG